MNREFRPLLRMTFPPHVTDLTAGAEPGRRLFRSWMLLGGVVPVEYDDLAFEEVEPGHRFLERSTLLSQRAWQHERIVEPVGDGARLTDRVSFAPRVSWLDGLYRVVFLAIFRWRHRNVRALFGEIEE